MFFLKKLTNWTLPLFKDTIKHMKKQAIDKNKLFADYTSDEVFISRIKNSQNSIIIQNKKTMSQRLEKPLHQIYPDEK